MKCFPVKYYFLWTGMLMCIAGSTRGQSADDYRTRASGNWNANGTWQRYDGTAWIDVNGVAPNTVPASGDGAITILTTHTVTVTANVTVDQVTVDAGGQVTVNSSRTLTIANGTGTDITVNGKLSNNGTVTTTGTLSFGANSEYIHARNGGTIPAASWSNSSTCTVTGITNTSPSGFGQSFGNFTWNCTGQSNYVNFTGLLTTINGNFTVSSTGSDDLILTNGTNLAASIAGDLIMSGGSLLFTDNNANVTLNVTGNFTQSGGSLDFSDDNQIGVLVMNVTGNFTQTGGSFDFTSGGNNVARTPALNLSGNFTQSGSATLTTSTNDADITNGTVTFNKNGTQTFSIATQGNVEYTNFVVAASSTLELNSSVTLSSISTAVWAGTFTVNSNGILNAKTYQVLSSAGTGQNNSFTLNSGATVMTANVNGLQSGNNGTISTSLANRTYSSGANYVYNGASIQNSGIFTTTPAATQVNNLTVNNTGGGTGLTLQQIFSVAGTCYFTAGRITSSSTNLLVFNDNAVASGANNNVTNPSYVNGPVRKIGNDAFTFPVGKSTVGYMLCAISAPSNTTDAFTAEYLRNSASALGSCTAVGLYRVSACEYWSLDRTTGSSSVNVTLSWSGLSPCNAATYVNDLSSLVVAHFNGTSWNSYGNNGGVTGNGAAGTVTWNNVSTFSPFTLGSTSAVVNPLPVKFSEIRASIVTSGNKVEWKNLTEENIERYEVERSGNGTDFSSIISVAPKSNNGLQQDYSVIDEHILNGTNFYRIKGVEADGTYVYSAIVKVLSGDNDKSAVSVYPNPVGPGQFTIQLNNYSRGNYSLRLISSNGQQVMSSALQHAGGSVSITMERSGSVKPGIYILKITGDNRSQNIKLMMK